MGFLEGLIEFIKGNNGTWPQAMVTGTFLNFRFWLFCFLLFFLYRKLEKKSLKSFIIFFIIFIFMVTDIQQMYVRQQKENIEYKTEYFDENTENLVIVIQGANNPFYDTLDKNKTQVDITKSRDLDGLGYIESNLNNHKTKVLTYVASYSYNLTPQEVYTNIYYHKLLKPNGKIILVGHSLGAYNIVQILNKLKKQNINIDLVIFLDIANKKNNSTNYYVNSNVNRIINFTSDEWSDNFYFFTNSGGKVFREYKNKKTQIYSYHIKNTTHTTIDNKIYKKIFEIIKSEVKK